MAEQQSPHLGYGADQSAPPPSAHSAFAALPHHDAPEPSPLQALRAPASAAPPPESCHAAHHAAGLDDGQDEGDDLDKLGGDVLMEDGLLGDYDF